MKTYYKVVTEDLESLTSIAPIQYKIDQWVGPHLKGSAIFVFDTLQHAKNFRRRWSYPSYNPIYKVVTKGMFHKPPFVLSHVSDTLIKICQGLKLRKQHKKDTITTRYYGEIPQGTVCVKEVKLMERVF